MSPLTKTILTSLNEKPVSRRKRTGKIAQLPKAVRERINHLLDDGRDYPAILKDLGPHAEGISHQNLTNWRQGGYQDHLEHQRELECIRTQTEAAADLIHEQPGISIPQLLKACDTVAVTQLFHVIMHHGEEVLIRGLKQHPIKYLNLLNTICNMNDSQIRAQMLRIKLEDRAAASAAKSTELDKAAPDREAARLKANVEIIARAQAEMRKRHCSDSDKSIQTPLPQAPAQYAEPEAPTSPVVHQTSNEPPLAQSATVPIPAHPQLPQAESPRSRKANQAFTIQASELHFAATAPSPADQKPSEVVSAPNRFENYQEPSIDPQPENETSESVGGTPSFNHDSSQAIRAHLVALSVESPRSRKPNQGIDNRSVRHTYIHRCRREP